MKKENVQIKIIKHWNNPPEKGFSVGDEYIATLFPCNGERSRFYAVLESGTTIPNGCFRVLSGEVKSTVFTKEFSQGYVAALTAMLSSHGMSTPIAEAWRANFGRSQTLSSLEKLGIDSYDIGIIKPFLKELNKK